MVFGKVSLWLNTKNIIRCERLSDDENKTFEPYGKPVDSKKQLKQRSRMNEKHCTETATSVYVIKVFDLSKDLLADFYSPQLKNAACATLIKASRLHVLHSDIPFFFRGSFQIGRLKISVTVVLSFIAGTQRHVEMKKTLFVWTVQIPDKHIERGKAERAQLDSFQGICNMHCRQVIKIKLGLYLQLYGLCTSEAG